MALQDPNIMPSSRLDCPLSLKTPNMGNPGVDGTIYRPPRSTKLDKIKNLHSTDSIDTGNSGTRGRSI